jgi:N-formylglutamate amidohydrolase
MREVTGVIGLSAFRGLPRPARSWFDPAMQDRPFPAPPVPAFCAPPMEVVDDVGAAFTVHEPLLQVIPAVVGVPHAGRRYPRSFIDQARLPAQALRRSEDAFVDLLAQDVPSLGTPMLVAQFPRAFLDVNREPYELDPRMFEGRLPPFVNARSMRVAGGLGTIPRIVGDGQDIYASRLPAAEASQRIETFYKPYHNALHGLISRTRSQFGVCVMVDLHSMPSTGLDREGGMRPDIILGDRFGTSALTGVVNAAEEALRGAGFSVSRNRPYAGGYITEHYGQPRSRINALQIEINRGLYMNEARIEALPGFGEVRAALARSLASMFSAWTSGLMSFPAAAE